MIVFCVSILFLFTFNVTSNRYMGQIEGEAKVAIPIISLENPTFNYIPDKMLPGDIRESDFYVSNFDNKNTNEVLMKYYLKVTLDSEIPIKVTLTNEDVIIKSGDGKTPETAYEVELPNEES